MLFELTTKHFQGAKLFANRKDMIRDLPVPKDGVVAEIGVAYGIFSEEMINVFRPRTFVAVDIFDLHNIPVLCGEKTAERFQGKNHRQYYEHRMQQFNLQSSGVEMRIHEGDSSLQLAKEPDDSIDLIYIDAAHHYEGVMRDATVAMQKVKRHGYIIFNDYIMYDHYANVPYGVVQVVNEICVKENWKVVSFALQTQMFCDICIQRM